MDAEAKHMFLSLILIFFYVFIAKNSSLLPIPKLNVLVIKENCEEKNSQT